MGTTCTNKPQGQSVKDFFLERGVLTWPQDLPHTYRVLDSALVKLHEFYAAIEQVDKATGERRVWAAVIKVSFHKSSSRWGDENFCWKDMDETMDPYFHNCPERILDLLTPTDNEYALAWRAKCREVLARKAARPKIVEGTTLRYGGNRYRVLEVLGRGYLRVMSLEGCVTYRMRPGQARQATIES